MMNLSQEQQAAVVAGPRLCISACAGSGKSTVLVERIAHQVAQGVFEGDIVAITYTRRAAESLRHRLQERGITPRFVGTVHSWSLMELNENVNRLDLTDGSLKAAPASLFDRMIEDEKKAAGITSNASPLLELVFRKVRSKLEADGLIDFDGILLKMLELVLSKKHPEVSLFVDEYQDTGPIEQAMYEAMDLQRFTIVGDVRQCLYEFRGADPKSMDATAERMGMERVSLTRNFRCTEEIEQEAQKVLIGDGVLFVPAELKDIGETIKTHREATVLCGYNATIDQLEEWLTKNGVPVAREKNKLERMQLEAYLRMKSDEYPNAALLRNAINLVNPERLKVLDKIAGDQLVDLIDLFDAEEELRLFEPLMNKVEALMMDYPHLDYEELAELVMNPTEPESMGVRLMTIHGAKGLEWDSVIFVDDLRQTEGHARMRYVACTRARKNLLRIKFQEGWNR